MTSFSPAWQRTGNSFRRAQRRRGCSPQPFWSAEGCRRARVRRIYAAAGSGAVAVPRNHSGPQKGADGLGCEGFSRRQAVAPGQGGRRDFFGSLLRPLRLLDGRHPPFYVAALRNGRRTDAVVFRTAALRVPPPLRSPQATPSSPPRPLFCRPSLLLPSHFAEGVGAKYAVFAVLRQFSCTYFLE